MEKLALIFLALSCFVAFGNITGMATAYWRQRYRNDPRGYSCVPFISFGFSLLAFIGSRYQVGWWAFLPTVIDPGTWMMAWLPFVAINVADQQLAPKRYRLRKLMIRLALGLMLLELALFMLPDKINLPGGMLGWLVLVATFHLVIPIALAVTLAVLAYSYSIQFTILDVLWLTAFVGLGLAWSADRSQYTAEAVKYQNMNTKAEAHLHYQGLLLDQMDPNWRHFKGSFREYTGKTPAPSASTDSRP